MSLFKNTLKQIRNAAKLMDLNEEVERVLSVPMRKISVNIPVRMDDGRLEIFKGFRMQHNNYLGPYKGGIRFHEKVDEEEKRLADLDYYANLVELIFAKNRNGPVFNKQFFLDIQSNAIRDMAA